MSCYFRYLKDVLAEAKVTVTPANKRELDQAIHAFVKVQYKRCMPDCWSKVKAIMAQSTRRTALVKALRKLA